MDCEIRLTRRYDASPDDHRRVAAALGMRYIGRWTSALARFEAGL